MIKVIMHGCNGRMGQVITDICENEEDVQIVAGVDVYEGVQNPYPVYKAIRTCDMGADVIIDFSNAAAIDTLLDYSVAKQIPVVLCSTGLSQEQLEHVERASSQIAILKSANMSLGINVMMDLMKRAANILADSGFDVEIIEKHHNQKLDAPSGTAIALADVMNEATDGSFEYVYDRSQVRKKRNKKELGIASIRGGNIVGEHEIIFAGMDEVISFKHTAYSRSVFAKGAVEAAKFLCGKEAGLYDMSDVIAAKRNEMKNI